MTSPKAMKEMAERLRAGPTTSRDYGLHLRKYQDLCAEAAAMLEAAANTLQTPVDSDVREALKKILNLQDCSFVANEELFFEALSIARAALAQKDKVKP